MHCLGSNSFVTYSLKYICACFLRQLLVIANSILKKLIIPGNLKGVYHKGDSNVNDKYNETFRSFKSKENIHKKGVGPYRGFGY